MDTTQKKTDSIIIGNCLACNGLVRIPSTLHAKSTVRCPHCSESFPLQKVIEQSIPELELVDQKPTEEIIPRADQSVRPKTDESTKKTRDKFVVPSQLSKGAVRSRRRRRSSDRSQTASRSDATAGRRSTDGVRVGPSRSPSPSHRSSGGSRSHSSRHRSKEIETSSVKEILKIVIGALLAFPIAYLLILWIVRTDPLQIAPSIGNVVPLAVPAEYRQAEVGEEPNGALDEVRQRKQGEVGGETSSDNGNDEGLDVPDVNPDNIR
jgi:hypothetical protein